MYYILFVIYIYIYIYNLYYMNEQYTNKSFDITFKYIHFKFYLVICTYTLRNVLYTAIVYSKAYSFTIGIQINRMYVLQFQ